MAGRARSSPRRRPRKSWVWRYRRLLFLVGLLAFTAIAGVSFVLSRVPLPDAAPPDQTTFLYASDGSRLATLTGDVNRVLVPLKAIPTVVVDAVVATEDRRFYEHGGVDPVGVARAVVHDLTGHGGLQGGSTITQQYVKNTYVGRERTVWRKLKEAVIAVKLERELTKDELLARYLNTVYFGRGAYGVQAAAQAWFGKDVGGLGLREASYLAGLIRAPEAADVARDPVTAATRRRIALTSMRSAGRISAVDGAEVEAQDLAGYVVPAGRAAPAIVAAEAGTKYFVDYVRKLLVDRYDKKLVFGGGLRVKTTLDLGAQRAAYKAVYGVLNRPADPAGALVAVDDAGRIRAMVGGRDFEAQHVNLAVGRDGGGQGRQPGSTFKPILLAEAVREGYSVESSFPAPAKIVLPHADGGKDWTVSNYNDEAFGGSINLLEATRESVNTVYAQAEVALGADNVVTAAHDLGITAPLQPVASLVLGTVEVSPLDIAAAYSTFARRGERVTPYVIASVETADGKVLDRAAPPRKRVLSRDQADVVNTALQDVVERGTGTLARWPQAGRSTLIGKTGTTDNYGDAWFVGATTTLTAAVWMGYPEGNAHTLERFRGAPVTGGTVPADIWRRFMVAATKGQNLVAFPRVSAFPGKILGSTRVAYRVPPVPGPSTSTSAGGRPAGSTTVPGKPAAPTTQPGKPTPPPSSPSTTAPPTSPTTKGAVP